MRDKYVRYSDSTDKIVHTYLAGVARQEFTYKNNIYKPKNVVVTKNILREFTCVAACGACCGNFSLDYLPAEDALPLCTSRQVVVNGTFVTIRSYLQDGNSSKWCDYLEHDTGLCTAYSLRPFACYFEPIRFLHYDEKVLITQKGFGRGWAMERVTGGCGALCEFGTASHTIVKNVVEKMNRLQAWADAFKITTCIPTIIDWVSAGTVGERLFISAAER